MRRGAALGAPRRISRDESRRNDPGARGRGHRRAGRLRDRRISRRDAGRGLGRPPAAASGSPAARAEVRRLLDWFLGKIDEEVTGYLVTEKIFKRFMARGTAAGRRTWRRSAAARANIRYHLKYIGYLIATRNWLAGDRSDLCGSRGGGASVARGLSRRRAMGRGRDGKALVRAGEVPAVLPRAPGRPGPGHAAGGPLRGSGLLNRRSPEARRSPSGRRALGFDTVRVASA